MKKFNNSKTVLLYHKLVQVLPLKGQSKQPSMQCDLHDNREA